MNRDRSADGERAEVSASSDADRDLGLFQPITRRDLLHGIGAAAAGTLAWPLASLAAESEFAPERAPDYYPPDRTGLRGSHVGSFEVAHELAWNSQMWPDPADLEESYDVVVVGGGISGLAAAYLYRKAAGGTSRILVLDNHDDFGGHAKRNEFQHDGRRYVSLGGSVLLGYTAYAETTLGLLRELGVDIARLRAGQDPSFIYHPFGLASGIYFDAASWGRDRVVTGELLPLARTGSDGEYALLHQIDAMPLSASARSELKRFLTRRTDYLPDVPDAAKPRALRKLSYHDFLVKHAGLSEEAAGIFFRFPAPLAGVGTDSVPVDACLEMGMPGFRGLGGFGRAAEADLAGYPLEDIPGAYFPDGNASIPRLLVRTLIPAVAPGESMEDVVAARFDYARLDEPDSSVRIRLNSTAVRVEAQGERGVAVTYVRGGRAQRVRARNCVLACNNAMIPYLCPQLPGQQREALRFGVRCPLISTNVLLRDGRALERLGAAGFYCAGRMHSMVFAFGRSLGRYRYAWNPAEPVVLHMIATLAQPGTGVPPRDQFRRGQRRLYAMSFSDLEREIRQHLAGMLGGAGFEPARDILAITVNRWPHGYAYRPSHLFDPDYAEGQAPHEIGRRRFGHIAIANSDAGGRALVDSAIDQAHRAIGELAKAQLI